MVMMHEDDQPRASTPRANALILVHGQPRMTSQQPSSEP